MRTQLAKGEIAAEDSHSRVTERIRQRDKKQGVAVRSGTVRQDEAVAAGSGRRVQIAANGYAFRIISKFPEVGHMDRVVLSKQPQSSIGI